MRLSFPLAAACVALFLGATVQPHAAPRNDVPSCRGRYFGEDAAVRPIAREFVIVVDRTVSLDKSLRGDIVGHIARTIAPGDRVIVLTFSGLTASEFTKTEFDGRVDTVPPETDFDNRIPGRMVDEARQCFVNQLIYVRRKVSNAVADLMAAPLGSARRSEIMLALSQISRATLSVKIPHDKTVLIVSDMLEFSDIASFYAGNRLRLIVPADVLATARRHSLFGDFRGAKIFVAGAAAVESAKYNENIREREALREFWSQWFVMSHGDLREWGEPALLHDIQ